MSEELLAAAVRLGVPLLLAALGELLAQRAGVVNIGVEGMMLGGALGGAVGAQASGSPWLGMVAGVAVGVGLAALFASIAVVAGGDLIVTGTGLNLLALGATGFAYRALVARSSTGLEPPLFTVVEVPFLSRLPFVGQALFAQQAPAYLAIVMVVGVWLLLTRSGLGLRLRAAGEAPRALDAAGADVTRLRVGAVVAGGAFAGAGGASLVLAHAGTFVEGMTAGRGFIALALVICAGWRPWGTLLTATLFGLAMALQFQLQTTDTIPYQFVRMLPYVATLAVLAVTSRGDRAPAALGKSYR